MADGINLGKAYVQIIPSAEGIQGSLTSIMNGEASVAGTSAGKTFGSSMGGVLKTGFGVAAGAAVAGAAAVAGFGKAVVENAKETAAYGDNIDKLSQKIGISAEAFQEWDYVFSQNGADIGILETGMKTLASAVADAGNGSKSAQEKLNMLGLTYDDLGKMTQEDIFATVISRLQELPEGAERTSVAADLLGKSAMELGPLLNQTAEDTQALKDQAHDLGAVMSDEAVKDAAAYTDSMDNLSRAFAGAKNALSDQFMPGLTEVTNGLANLIAGNEGAADQLTSGFKKITDGLTESIPGIVDMITGLVSSIAEVAPDILKTLGEGIISAIPDLIPVVTDLILELSKMLIQMLPQLIEVGLQVILQLALGIAQALPELVPTIVDVILTIVEFLIDNIDLLVDASIAIIIGLAEGLIAALPKLIEKAPVIIEKLVSALIRNLPKIAQAAVQLIVTLVTGLVQNLPKIVESGGKIITSIIQGIGSFLSKLPEHGKKIINTVWDGIKSLDPVQWGKDMIQNFINGIKSMIGAVGDAIGSVASTVKDFLGFSEPSKGPLSKFHTFAPDMLQLFAQGIDQNTWRVTDSMTDLGDDIQSTLQRDLSGSALNVAADITAHDRAGMSGVNMGGVTIQVYGAPGQDERVIAQKVSEILNRQVINTKAVFA